MKCDGSCGFKPCNWEPDDDKCLELIRKALDEINYNHHNLILDWLCQLIRERRSFNE